MLRSRNSRISVTIALATILTLVAALAPTSPSFGVQPPIASAQSSGSYVQTFDDPSSLDEFDFAIHHAWVYGDTHDTWIGDHSLDCGAPDPGRVIENPTAIDGQTYYPDTRGGVVYWCREHIMTSFNSQHYAQIDFAPKETFTGVTRVCWDQTRTDVGARQWTQMVIVPMGTFNANGGRMDYVSSRLAADPGPGAFGLQVTGDTFLFALSDGGTLTQTGTANDIENGGNWTTPDKAARYTICVADQNNGTVLVELEHDTGVQVRTMDGSFPAGDVRVIFQDDTYNADKDIGVPGANTFHWDNLIIDTGGNQTVVTECDGKPVTINMNTNGGNGTGTSGNDVILGTPGADVIDAGDGNDTVCGGNGNDEILGGNGNDRLFGEAGQDIVRGGPDADLVDGSSGNDRLLGGTGNDTINGGDGDDYIGGFGDDDIINGGNGNEIIFGGFGADTINGGPGDDQINGLVGDDTIDGGTGNDVLNGDRGNDTIAGDAGDDVINGGNGNDVLSGELGDDIVSGGKADDDLSGGDDVDTCSGNLENVSDTSDGTCETMFGFP